MLDRIRTDLERLLKDKPARLKHIYGVKDKAIELGIKYNLDLEKLEIASLLHDITKYLSIDKHKEIIRDFFKDSDRIFKEFNDHILHAFSAYAVSVSEYHVTDQDILDSIKSHTVGRPDMSMYEKVIFIADYTEINRTYESCVKTRGLLEKSLDLAVYTAIDDSIMFYENIGNVIPKDAYDAREYYKRVLEVNHGQN